MSNSSNRVVATIVGATVGAVLGLVAASSGQIAAPVVGLLALAGAAFGYAECCWRQPPRAPIDLA